MILFIGTSRKTKGGITSVLKSYEKMSFWNSLNCFWIETHIDSSIFKKIIYFLKSIILYFKKIKNCKIVHIHLSWYVSVIRKLPFILLSSLFKKKIIIHIHASYETTIGKFPLLYNLIMNIADEVILIYPSFKTEKKFEKKVNYIFNPFNHAFSNNSSSRENIIVFSGTVVKDKGVFDLIQSFSMLLPKYNNWKLYIVGSGELEDCKKLIKSKKIENNVMLLGWIKNDRLIQILKKSKVFCLPSYTEGFPMSIIEAIHSGLTVVSTSVGGIGDIIKNEKSGFISKPGNTTQLYKNLEMAINHKNLDTISNNAYKMVQKLTDPKKIESQIINLYNKYI